MSIQHQAAAQFGRVVRALYPSEATKEAERLFRVATRSWSACRRDDGPSWSAVGNDCSPYEFSLAFLPDRVDIRVIVEAQADPATVASYWQAATALNDELEREFAISLANWRAVADLFRPETTTFCSLVHGFRFQSNGSWGVRLYGNPAAKRGRSALETVSEALRRLELGHAVGPIASMLDADTSIGLFGVDLRAAPRMKIYLAHHGGTVDSLAALLRRVDDGSTADVAAFTETLLGRSGPFDGDPIRVCVTVDSADVARLSPWTLDVPIGAYVDDDSQAHARVLDVFDRFRIPVDLYRRALAALEPDVGIEQLASRSGLHTVASFQREGGEPRVTVYFSPQIYRRSRVGDFDRGALFRAWNGDIAREGDAA